MNIIKWLYKQFNIIKFYLGISMYNTDMEILKTPALDVDEKNKKIQRKKHHNDLLEKFYQGQRCEKYTQDYYEILKKGDEYLFKADARRMDLTADKWGMSYGRKDPLGRRTYEHLGYFDPSHKNYGKTLSEVLNTEIEERSLNDSFDMMYMFDNRPLQLNLVESADSFNVKNGVMHNKRPLMINRGDSVIINKIEDITDYIHVKKIGFEHRYYDFFIPKKFKLEDYDNNSDVFKELVGINNFWIKGKYGELYGFTVTEFIKRIDYNQEYEVLKFKGTEIINIESK